MRPHAQCWWVRAAADAAPLLATILLQASAAVLASFYVEGPVSGPPPALGALTALSISGPNITAAELAARSQARLDELAVAAAGVALLPEVQLALNLTAPGPPWTTTSWPGRARLMPTRPATWRGVLAAQRAGLTTLPLGCRWAACLPCPAPRFVVCPGSSSSTIWHLTQLLRMVE